MPLPIVARILGVHKTETSVAAVHQSISMFDSIDELQDDTGKISYVGRRFDDDGSASKLLVIPATTLKRYGKPTKTDIRWLWKEFNGMGKNDRARWEDTSYLTMLWTNEPELYMASNNVEITTWAQPDWVWTWFKYIHSLPGHLQRKGILKFMLGDVVKRADDVDILKEVSSLMRNQKRADDA